MLVARSYNHVNMISNIPRYRSRERHSKPKKEQVMNEKQDIRDGIPKFMSSVTTPTSSKPVVIPTRTSTSASAPKARTRQEKTTDTTIRSYDPRTVPPSMAALLAVASVHNTSSLAARRNFSTKLSKKEDISPDDLRYTLSSSSPRSWNILQSPPCEDEESKECDGDAFSLTSTSTAAPLSSYRSLSTNSIPSLDTESDYESITSDPPTPAARRCPSRPKLLSPRSSLREIDHPLSPPSEHDLDDLELITPVENKTFAFPLSPSKVPKPQSHFTSNLTASIRLLKSAALTTLSTISPTQYTVNPLPLPTSPRTTQLAPASGPILLSNIDALPFHLTSALPDLPMSQTSIQLMPYIPSTVPSSTYATAPPVFLPAASPSKESISTKSLTRPREPRENGDFLRVVVMEMNMRRAGKLNSEGRARIWLGARKDTKTDQTMIVEQRHGAVVPQRWVATSV